MRKTTCCALSLFMALSVPLAASAQEEPSAADVSAARALGQDGIKLADAGNCADAVDKLSRSEKIFHAPTTLERLGECQVQLGKIVDGTENLNKVVRESLPASSPPAFLQAQERAKKVLADAKPKIAKLKIAVAAPDGAQLVVKLDGEQVPLANLNTNRPTDPGDHVVEASAPGYKTASARVKLSEGGVDSVALTLETDPNAPPVAPVVPVVAPPVQPPPQPPPQQPPPGGETGSGGGSKIPAYAALGVGVVGLGLGTIFGLVASGKKSDLDSACGPTKVCPAGQQDNIDSAKSSATVSTVGFVVGGVGIAAGAVLYLLATGSSSTGSVTPYVGLGNAGVNGRF